MAEVPPPQHAVRTRPSRVLLASGLIALLTLASYLPGLTNAFVWDDDIVLLGNPHLHPPTVATLGFYLTHPFWNLYMPVTAWLYAGLARLSPGFADTAPPSAVAFHLAGAAAHAAAAGLLLLLLHHVTQNRAAAAAGALLFALHPIQVEAVAFAGALNNPVCGLFSMGAILGFCLATEASRPDRRVYAIATILLLLALLSKPTAVVVPVIAVAFAAIDHRRSSMMLLRWALPWFVIAAGFALFTTQLQGAAVPAAPLPDRLRIAGSSVAFYLPKILWLASLGIDYGRTPAVVLRNPLTPLLALTPVALIALAVWAWLRNRRALAAAIVIYAVGLLPNSGLIPFDSQQYSTNSDRYAYLAMLGPALMVACFFSGPLSLWGRVRVRAISAWRASFFARNHPHPKPLPKGEGTRIRIAIVIVSVTVALLLPAQQRQLATWRNEQTLFRHALTITPNSWWTWGDLAHADLVAGRFPAAAAEARRSVTLRPDSLVGWENLGLAERNQHHAAAALDAFAVGLDLAPANPLAQQNYLQARAALAATMPAP